MGVVKTLFKLIAGPLVIYGLLMGHTFCRVFLQDPKPIHLGSIDGKTQGEIKEMLKQRDVIVEGVKQALSGTYKGDFVTDLGSKEGIEFEDPFQKYEGETQFRVFLNMAKKYVSSVEFELHKKYQGTDEILLDWTLTMANTMMPDWPLVMPMRTHIILSKAGKVKRISEEWYGNEQINEANTFFLWGRMHMKLRKFIGTMAVESVNRGWI